MDENMFHLSKTPAVRDKLFPLFNPRFFLAALAGNNEQFWDAKNKSGTLAATGVFVYKIEATSLQGETQSIFGKCAVMR
jgi:hypothetical protein